MELLYLKTHQHVDFYFLNTGINLVEAFIFTSVHFSSILRSSEFKDTVIIEHLFVQGGLLKFLLYMQLLSRLLKLA